MNILMFRVGSARMGLRSNDPSAVVNERLEVYGVKNLRIGDASVIPLIPNGNVHSTVVLFAERTAELLESS